MLTAKQTDMRTTVETLDKKRKFVEILPKKIGVVLDSAIEVTSLFEGVSTIAPDPAPAPAAQSSAPPR